MNRDKVMKWVKALESGRYKQGEGQLSKDGAYCCLGVAARINRATHDPSETNLLLNVRPYANNGEHLYSLAKELGITETREKKLVRMNDGDAFSGDKQRSFKYIAKWIRKNILKEKGIVLREEE